MFTFISISSSWNRFVTLHFKPVTFKLVALRLSLHLILPIWNSQWRHSWDKYPSACCSWNNGHTDIISSGVILVYLLYHGREYRCLWWDQRTSGETLGFVWFVFLRSLGTVLSPLGFFSRLLSVLCHLSHSVNCVLVLLLARWSGIWVWFSLASNPVSDCFWHCWMLHSSLTHPSCSVRARRQSLWRFLHILLRYIYNFVSSPDWSADQKLRSEVPTSQTGWFPPPPPTRWILGARSLRICTAAEISMEMEAICALLRLQSTLLVPAHDCSSGGCLS